MAEPPCDQHVVIVSGQAFGAMAAGNKGLRT
jgi:hypothetical protein